LRAIEIKARPRNPIFSKSCCLALCTAPVAHSVNSAAEPNPRNNLRLLIPTPSHHHLPTTLTPKCLTHSSPKHPLCGPRRDAHFNKPKPHPTTPNQAHPKCHPHHSNYAHSSAKPRSAQAQLPYNAHLTPSRNTSTHNRTRGRDRPPHHHATKPATPHSAHQPDNGRASTRLTPSPPSAHSHLRRRFNGPPRPPRHHR
jgi:hypothetical protein